MNFNDFKSTLTEKYPYALIGVFDDQNAREACDLICKNIGFRKVDDGEQVSVVLQTIIEFLENKHG